MKTRIHESGTISVDKSSNALRVCLISEGQGSSALFEREFFTEENANALKGVLSWPSHPEDLSRPERRDPLSAIGSIGDNVTIEEHDGKLSIWGEYIPAKSKPQIAEYIREYGPKLGLSVYGDAETRPNPNGRGIIAESLDGTDEYRSVDLVVAAGRGGKFEKVSESLGLLPKTSATAEEKEETHMTLEELATKVDRLTVIAEGLVATTGNSKIAEAQVKVDAAAVETAVAARLVGYDKAVNLISEAKLTKSQSDDLRAKALKGEDITEGIETAKAILAEALALNKSGDNDDDSEHKIAENHLGSSTKKNAFNPDVSGFGKVS